MDLKQIREDRKSRGLCPNCNLPAEPGFVNCPNCRSRSKKRYTTAVEAGKCVKCANPARKGNRLCEHHLELVRLKDAQDRDVVLAHYNNCCACCGEATKEFLTIDHINNDGADHRREVGRKICAWLIRNNFPPGFQVLCANCNHAKAYYGQCPHRRQS
jgi:hypothetical protein